MSGNPMLYYGDAGRAWLAHAGYPEGAPEIEQAAFTMGLLRYRDDAAGVLGVATVLTGQDIASIEELDPLHALAFAVAMDNAEVIGLGIPAQDTAEHVRLANQIREHVRTVHPEGEELLTDQAMIQAAAFAAIRQLGGAGKLAIPEWMEMAVGDVNHPVCEHILGPVEMACRQTSPGRRWCHVQGIGFVVYQPL